MISSVFVNNLIVSLESVR